MLRYAVGIAVVNSVGAVAVLKEAAGVVSAVGGDVTTKCAQTSGTVAQDSACQCGSNKNNIAKKGDYCFKNGKKQDNYVVSDSPNHCDQGNPTEATNFDSCYCGRTLDLIEAPGKVCSTTNMWCSVTGHQGTCAPRPKCPISNFDAISKSFKSGCDCNGDPAESGKYCLGNNGRSYLDNKGILSDYPWCSDDNSKLSKQCVYDVDLGVMTITGDYKTVKTCAKDDYQYELGGRWVCGKTKKPYRCSCSHGEPWQFEHPYTDNLAGCTDEKTQKCRHCYDGYYLHEGECKEKVCSCSSGGTAGTKTQCFQNGQSDCSACPSGYTRVKGQDITIGHYCQANVARCNNGAPVTQAGQVPNMMDYKCLSCAAEQGYKLENGECRNIMSTLLKEGAKCAQADKCQSGVCKVDDTKQAKGAVCETANQQSNCQLGLTCTAGATKDDKPTCKGTAAEQTCNGDALTAAYCANGTPQTLANILANNDQTPCTKCNTGYQLNSNNECEEIPSTCKNGNVNNWFVLNTLNADKSNKDNTACAFCDQWSGFHWEAGKAGTPGTCEKNVCTCNVDKIAGQDPATEIAGTAAPYNQCFRDKANICDSNAKCKENFELAWSDLLTTDSNLVRNRPECVYACAPDGGFCTSEATGQTLVEKNVNGKCCGDSAATKYADPTLKLKGYSATGTCSNGASDNRLYPQSKLGNINAKTGKYEILSVMDTWSGPSTQFQTCQSPSQAYVQALNIWSNMKATGSPCTADYQCKSQYATGGGCKNAGAAQNKACSLDTDCASLDCDSVTKKCTGTVAVKRCTGADTLPPKGKAGGACTSDANCAANFYCSSKTSTCTATIARGEACDSTDALAGSTRQCAFGQKCPEGANKKCPKANDDQDCATSNGCNAGSYCKDKKCAKKIENGQPCTSNGDADQCASGQACPAGADSKCPAAPTKKADGAQCTAAGECTSNKCEEKKTGDAEGTVCTTANAASCKSESCPAATGADKGATCTKNRECKSNKCMEADGTTAIVDLRTCAGAANSCKCKADDSTSVQTCAGGKVNTCQA